MITLRSRGGRYRNLIVFCCISLISSLAAEVAPSEVGEGGGTALQGEILKSDLKTSTAGLISVIGGNQHARSSILSIAETMKSELFVLGDKTYEDQKFPLVVQLIGGERDSRQDRSMVTKVESVEGAYRMKLYIHLVDTLDYELLRYHLMELFLYERGVSSGHSLVEGERFLVKPWLITGLLEAIKIKSDREDKDLYRADADYLSILNIERVLSLSEMELRGMVGGRSAAFQAVSGAMVNALLRQPKGKAAMEGFLADFATFKGEPEDLLRKHFPGMNKSKSSLEKWVHLELLELRTADTTDVLSISETDDRLERHLQFRYKNEAGVIQNLNIYGYEELLELKAEDRSVIMRGASAELQRLTYRCFPEYRPIIYEYLVIFQEVIRGEGANITGRLAALNATRQKMKEVDKRATDYLSWYYITQSNHVGGGFKAYRDISDALEKESSKVPADDHMKVYLDNIQRLFSSQ